MTEFKVCLISLFMSYIHHDLRNERLPAHSEPQFSHHRIKSLLLSRLKIDRKNHSK